MEINKHCPVTDLKKKIVADMERVTPEHCIFATNTSAIPITKIAEGAGRPENIIGMHYFSPVPMMPLLEIIPHEGTSDIAKATAFEVLLGCFSETLAQLKQHSPFLNG